MTTLLLQLESPGRLACAAWTSVAASAITQVIVTCTDRSAAGSPSDRDASRLFDALGRALTQSGAVAAPARCGGSFQPRSKGCWATKHPGQVRRVLVLVMDAGGGAPLVGPSLFSPQAPTVVPVMPAGTPPSVLPNGLGQTVIAFHPPGAPEIAVPEILLQAGVASDAFRIFISYRWDDAATIAEQIFDALSHERFDVYLDRFRTPPGQNFLERIRHELADKACVLLLETDNVSRSPWVAGEYAFARKHRLGLLAVDLPGSRANFAAARPRLSLKSANGGTPLGSSGRLGRGEIDGIVRFVRDNYGAQVSRRWRHQRRLLHAAAGAAGLSATEAGGAFEITGGGKLYRLAVSARPPTLDVFRAAASPPGSAQGVVVGPLFAMMHAARADITWLDLASGIRAVDERRLYPAMQAVAKGSL